MIRETSEVRWRQRVAATDGEAARAVPETTNTAAPSSTGDERCAARGTTPVRRDLTARDLGCTATAAGNPHAGAIHRRVNGRRLLRIGAPVAAYFTAGRANPPPVSGRGSRGFFAGVPDPASQQPRFSASFAPGTRPCHRQWTSSLALHPACGIAGCQGAWPEMRAVTSGW